MTPRHVVAQAALALLLLSFAPSLSFAAWPTSVYDAVPLSQAINDQNTPATASDGAGGAFVGWVDSRTGANDIYASRITSSGTTAPGWPADGLPVCTAAGAQYDVQMVAGTAGDAYLIWVDERAGNRDIYAQRVMADGSIAPGWPVGGLALTSYSNDQYGPVATADGAGGFYAAWTLVFSLGTDNDVYAIHVLPDGTFGTGYPLNGIGINEATLIQQNPAIVADGSGNAIIAYENVNGSNVGQIWGQKIGPTGSQMWGSPGSGVNLSELGNDLRNPILVTSGAGGAVLGCDVAPTDLNVNEELFASVSSSGQPLELGPFDPSYGNTDRLGKMVSDGDGGAFFTATVYDGTDIYLYADHMQASGAVALPVPGWLAEIEYGSQARHDLTPGGGGSAVLTWESPDDGNDLRAQRFDAGMTGVWSPGTFLARGPFLQREPSVIPDGAGGYIGAWEDDRSGTSYDIYASRIDRFGYPGDAAPAITALGDVPNDQGGFLSLEWTASYLDAEPDFPIARYSLWRRAPGGFSVKPSAGGAVVLAPDEARPTGVSRVVRAQPTAAGVVYWEYLSDVPARGYTGYSATVATTSDSIGGSNPLTSYRVEAETSSGIPYWDSAPDSGYSVDNLAPTTPAPFTGTYSGGTSTLAWGANVESDFGVYRLYRGSSSTFVPGPGNLVSEQTQTGYTDAAGGPYWYKLAAVDVHGNVSPYATLLPSGATGTPGEALPREVALAAPWPNPATGLAVTRFSLPRDGAVSLAVFDASGRRVRDLATGQWSAGVHEVRWDGLSDAGSRVGAGLYFLRLSAEGRTFTRRLAFMR